jgi:hypothetical protein
LFAERDVQRAVGGDFLQKLEFPQPHQHRVVNQQLGRVGLAANRRRLLA